MTECSLFKAAPYEYTSSHYIVHCKITSLLNIYSIIDIDHRTLFTLFWQIRCNSLSVTNSG